MQLGLHGRNWARFLFNRVRAPPFSCALLGETRQMNTHRLLVALGLLLPGALALADVTVQEQTTINVAIIKAHATLTREFTRDKERSETDFRCDGLLSIICGKNKGLDIVRLDRDLTWSAEPKKKRYMEVPFPTPEQRRELEARMKATAEKMKACPSPAAPVASTGPDTTTCTLTRPKLTVTKTEDVATLAGHDARRTALNMIQSCVSTEPGSQDSCDMSYTLDVWLTDDDMSELADKQAYEKAYLRKLGIDDLAKSSALTPQIGHALAPYAEAMAELRKKSGDLHGYPLKTKFTFAFGGAHCTSAPHQKADGSSESVVGDAGSAAAQVGATSVGTAAGWGARTAASSAAGNGVGGYIAGTTAGAFAGKLVDGLFRKKKQTPAESEGATAATAPSPYTKVAEVTMETIAINSAPIAPDRFEMPAAWTQLPLAEKEAPAEFTCPKPGR